MKKRYIIIPLVSILGLIGIFLLCKCWTGYFLSDLDKRVNDLVDKRLAETYSVPNNSQPANSNDSQVDVSEPADSFTNVSWPGNSESDANEATTNKAKISATIANTEKANSQKRFRNLSIFDDYDTAFNSSEELASGRYVTIVLDTTVEVKNITGKVSFYNPDSEEFEAEDFNFESSVNSNNDRFQLTFKIPENPHVKTCYSGTIEIVIVFTVVTDEGEFFLTCAY